MLIVLLSLAAWRRGWRWWALLPLALDWGGALLIFAYWSSTDMKPTPDAASAGFIIDFFALALLVIMALVGNKSTTDQRPVADRHDIPQDSGEATNSHPK